MTTALLLILALLQAAADEPPADAPAPAAETADDHGAGETTSDDRDRDEEPFDAPARPARVYLIIDRHTELGGRLVGETADEIVIEHEGAEKSFAKARIVSIIPLVEPAPGQSGVVRLRDGNSFRGVVLADDLDEVRMEIAGIETRFPRKSVLQVVLEESDLEKYLRLREAIPQVDHVRRLALCRWLHQRRMYTEALEELDRLLEDFDLGDARTLRAVVEAQLALDGPSSRSEPLAPTGEGGLDPGDVARGTIPLKELLPQRLLTRDDVNLIRVLEIDFRRPPRISIEPETIRTLIQRYAAHPAIPATSEGRTRMFRADPIDLVRLMFELKARDLYPQINVDSEPFALNLFRQRVHDAWLIGNCATSRCHGGLEGGRFFLHNRNSRDERVRFTNLLILLRSEWSDEPLVDFERPLDSLIIQHALPRTEARFPHPDVPGWKPVFTNANQRLLADAVRWIESMYQPRPTYPVEYEPPVLEPEIGLPPSPTEPPGGPTR
ncbi:MAG: hypothetical protein ACO38V_11065 [Phycisphaerales bacterium]